MAVEDGQLTPANGDEPAARVGQVPRLIPRGIRNDLKDVSAIEAQLQVQSAFPKFDGRYRCLRKAAVDFRGCVHRGREAKLMAVILTGDSDSARFDQTPEAGNDQVYALVEVKHPIELTAREGLNRVPDEPREFAHGISTRSRGQDQR